MVCYLICDVTEIHVLMFELKLFQFYVLNIY